jgi:N6-adenosine-specific RNA methylase IME4
MKQLARYEAACSALDAAVRVDEVKSVRDKAEAVRLYARMARDPLLEANAAVLRLRSERKGGQLLAELKAEGLLREGRPNSGKNKTKNGSQSEPFSLKTLGIDKRDSVRFQKVGGIAERAYQAAVSRVRHDIESGKRRVSLDIAKQEDKKVLRARRERDLAAKQRALPDKKYGVVYADPEWRFEPYSRESGMSRAADNHYPTSAVDEISRRPVDKIAAKDCVLFLWATVPMLPDAIDVMRAWGFAYKSHFIWRKPKIGTGYWNRNRHELLLIGTCGNIPAPAMGTQFESVIDAPLGRHSEKPDKFYDIIEAHFPNLPKIELNARRARKGWDAWGNEAPIDAKGKALKHDKSTGEVVAA